MKIMAAHNSISSEESSNLTLQPVRSDGARAAVARECPSKCRSESGEIDSR